MATVAPDRPRRPQPGSAAVTGLLLALLVGCGTQPPSTTGESSSPNPAQSPPATSGDLDELPGEDLVTTSPDQYTAVGELVSGFPIDLLPVPPDAVILVTSAIPVGDADVRIVSLNLRTSTTAVELLALYQGALTTAGFTRLSPDPADSGLAVDARFVRSGDELVSIGVLDDGDTRTVTIGGRVHTTD